jgi:hypothetical protein
MNAFTFVAPCSKNMMHHVQCGSIRASLHAVHNLAVVAGSLFLSLFVAL